MPRFSPSRFSVLPHTILVFLFTAFSTIACATPANSISLLSYMTSSVQAPPDTSTIPKYDRAKQFGGWAHQDPAHHCYDTREMVLERAEDPTVPLTFKSNGCTVASGLWHEPYAGTDVNDAKNLQIDHVVPLKAAYLAGAYAWSGPIRCNYANFIANDFHLLAVSAHENMSKGDRGPESYLPPREDELCAYVSNWMKIKMIWQLATTKAELAAIQAVIKRENCAEDLLYINQSILAEQRTKANAPITACANFGD